MSDDKKRKPPPVADRLGDDWREKYWRRQLDRRQRRGSTDAPVRKPRKEKG